MMPLWDAPEAWLRLLVNQEDLNFYEQARYLTKLMSVNWAMCGAVLRCMSMRRLVLKVCACDVTMPKHCSNTATTLTINSKARCARSRRTSTPRVSWHGGAGC
jgi:hypothetical protein